MMKMSDLLEEEWRAKWKVTKFRTQPLSLCLHSSSVIGWRMCSITIWNPCFWRSWKSFTRCVFYWFHKVIGSFENALLQQITTWLSFPKFLQRSLQRKTAVPCSSRASKNTQAALRPHAELLVKRKLPWTCSRGVDVEERQEEWGGGRMRDGSCIRQDVL